jgi:hypothetical protein
MKYFGVFTVSKTMQDSHYLFLVEAIIFLVAEYGII